MTLNLASPVAIDGDVTADNVDGARIVAMLLGLPRQAPGSRRILVEPAGRRRRLCRHQRRGDIQCSAMLRSRRRLTASDLKGVVRFRPSEIAFDNLDGHFAGGHLTGQVSLRRTADGLVGHGHVELADADAASLLQADKTAIAARLALKFDGDSIGASPAALIGAIHGGGSIGLGDAHLAGLDPAAFPAAMRAADQANAIAPPANALAKILAAVNAALGSGRLVVSQGEAAATITSGKINVANVTLRAQDGSALALAGALDLGTGAIDARVTLSGEPPPHALIRARPELAIALNGPLAAPARSLDISALTGWLALRAAELQTRRLESLEANGRREVIGRAIRPDFAAVRAAPRGTLVEYELQASAPVQGKPRLDLLQPPLPPAADAGPAGEVKPQSSPATAGRATDGRPRQECAARSTPAAELKPRPAAPSSFSCAVDRRRHGRWFAPDNGSSTNSRIADDRLPCGRPVSIARDQVRQRHVAADRDILQPFQNASSRLTLVLWPAMTIERLMTGDFIAHLPFRSGAGRGFCGLCR